VEDAYFILEGCITVGRDLHLRFETRANKPPVFRFTEPQTTLAPVARQLQRPVLSVFRYSLRTVSRAGAAPTNMGWWAFPRRPAPRRPAWRWLASGRRGRCLAVTASKAARVPVDLGYRRFRHQDRHVANSSFTLGMVAPIGDKLTAMKRERDAVNNGTGRDLVVLKASVVDAELEKIDLKLRTVRRATRMVSPTAYEAGETAGASLAINPGIRGT
jgi:hypothetical protein